MPDSATVGRCGRDERIESALKLHLDRGQAQRDCLTLLFISDILASVDP